MTTQKLNDTAIDELALALGLLVRRLRSEAPFEDNELSWTQKSVISRLEKDGPATIAELARAEGVKPQSMGTAIANLEAVGMVKRKPHATDGRQVNIKLTAKGISVRKVTKDAKRTWLTQAITKLDKHEQATLFEAGQIIKRLAGL